MTLEFDRTILGSEFDRTEHGAVTADEIREYLAASTEGPVPSADATDIVAPPTFVVRMRGRRFMPQDLPKLGTTGFDAGKDIEFGVPVRPGDQVTSVSTVHDIYEKTGRTGSMAFVVLRTVLTNQREQIVAIIDQKVMIR